MPYHLEKGQWFSVVEDYLNTRTNEELLVVLAELRAGKPLWQFEYVGAETLNGNLNNPSGGANPFPTREDREDHMVNHWFGMSWATNERTQMGRPSFGAVQTQLAADRATLEATLGAARQTYEAARGSSTAKSARAEFARLSKEFANLPLSPSTGYWSGYWGDVESIMRLSRIRAIEASLGLPEGDPAEQSFHDKWKDSWKTHLTPIGNVRRRLAIEYFWKCPQRWFEAWVTFRYEPKRTADPTVLDRQQGHVTVLLCTPGVGKPVYDHIPDGAIQTSRSANAGMPSALAATADEDIVAPVDDFQTRGMWVVAHEDHDVLPQMPPAAPSAKGAWVIPQFGPCYLGKGPVKAWQPRESAGGVKPFGRPWEQDRYDDLYGGPSTMKGSQAT